MSTLLSTGACAYVEVMAELIGDELPINAHTLQHCRMGSAHHLKIHLAQ